MPNDVQNDEGRTAIGKGELKREGDASRRTAPEQQWKRKDEGQRHTGAKKRPHAYGGTNGFPDAQRSGVVARHTTASARGAIYTHTLEREK